MLRSYTNSKNIVDDIINEKVNELIEQSIIENGKRRKIEHKVSNNYSIDSKDEISLISSTYELMNFPIYNGTGNKEHSPDIQGSLADDGRISQTLWYKSVPLDEFKEYKRVLNSCGFTGNDKEYVKVIGNKKYYMMVEYSKKEKLMRLYHTVSIEE